MKFSIFSTSLLFAVASNLITAAPTAEPNPTYGHLLPIKHNPYATHKGSFPFIFTSTFSIVATGAQVVNNVSVSTPGPREAVGYFNYGINSHTNTICYNITLINVKGDYQSLAKTATHIHNGLKGKAGPPRIAIPNPVGDDKKRVSVGCLVGPFTTGIKAADGKDTGTGFNVRLIELDPKSYFTDSHTKLFVAGVVRGQFA